MICDVCESAPAILFCAADEAALCRPCDEKAPLLLFSLFDLLELLMNLRKLIKIAVVYCSRSCRKTVTDVYFSRSGISDLTSRAHVNLLYDLN